MAKPLSYFLIVFFIVHIFRPSSADVGTASFYQPPYIPTACAGSDLSQFPVNSLFAAAGEGIWENGAACGRQYRVVCFSAAVPKSCIPNQEITITIVDRALTSPNRPAVRPTTMALSTTAYKSIVQGSVQSVVIEFREA